MDKVQTSVNTETGAWKVVARGKTRSILNQDLKAEKNKVPFILCIPLTLKYKQLSLGYG
jgi:hypothetical protein